MKPCSCKKNKHFIFGNIVMPRNFFGALYNILGMLKIMKYKYRILHLLKKPGNILFNFFDIIYYNPCLECYIKFCANRKIKKISFIGKRNGGRNNGKIIRRII